jgi:hypothetical protein
MKKYQNVIIIILVGIVLYLIWRKYNKQFIASKLEPTTDNDWAKAKFTVKSPFGKIVVNGMSEEWRGILESTVVYDGEVGGDSVILEDENYLIGKRSYTDRLEVYMAHKNETDPYTVSEITYDYNLKSILPEYRRA